MNIRQIKPSSAFGHDLWNKWFCSDSAQGSDGESVFRYLQADGTWDKIAYYFNSKEEIDIALQAGHQPDFTLSARELQGRADMRADLEADMEMEEKDGYGCGGGWEY